MQGTCVEVLGLPVCQGDKIRVVLRGRGMVIIDGVVVSATPSLLVLMVSKGREPAISAVRITDIKMIELIGPSAESVLRRYWVKRDGQEVETEVREGNGSSHPSR